MNSLHNKKYRIRSQILANISNRLAIPIALYFSKRFELTVKLETTVWQNEV